MQYKKTLNATEQAITRLSCEYPQLVLNARREFYKSFGDVKPDSDEFENHTYLFHYWLLFCFKSDELNISDWFLQQLVPTMQDSFSGMQWSLFEFIGSGLLKKNQIKNFLTNQKISIVENSDEPLLCKGDCFVGRVIPWEEGGILLPGLLMLPPAAMSALKKEYKKILKEAKGKSKEIDEDLKKKEDFNFVSKVSINANRWNTYSRREYKTIFSLK